MRFRDLDIDESIEKMKYENRIVSVVHEADMDGNVTVSESGGKPFVVKEADLTEATEDDVLQEEDAAMDMGASQPTDGITAPFAGNPTIDPSQDVELNLDVEKVEDFITIDLGKLEDELSSANLPEEDKNSIDDISGVLDFDAEEADDATPEEDPEDAMLQELLNLLDEQEVIEEEIEVVTYVAAEGDISTDLLSPGNQAHSRADRELHAKCMISEKAQSEIKELQKKVWGYQFDLETHTVETHIYRLRKKFLTAFNDESFILSNANGCLLYTSPSPRDRQKSRMPSSA